MVTKVYKGQAVNVGELVSAGGMNWYSVTLVVGGASYSGWICADYVAVNGQTSDDQSQGETTGVTDSEYEAALAAAGFPASYCSALASLHQKYPNWQFVPVQTGLDWNTVVSNESLVGRNLIQNSVNDARKSTDSQAYNWETNKWYGFDGASWVSASPEYTASIPEIFLTRIRSFSLKRWNMQAIRTQRVCRAFFPIHLWQAIIPIRTERFAAMRIRLWRSAPMWA